MITPNSIRLTASLNAKNIMVATRIVYKIIAVKRFLKLPFGLLNINHQLIGELS